MVQSAIQDVEEWNTKVKAKEKEENPPFEAVPRPESDSKKPLKSRKKKAKKPRTDELRDASQDTGNELSPEDESDSDQDQLKIVIPKGLRGQIQTITF
jgi:hypothetical protein